MDGQIMQEILQRFPGAIKSFLDNVNWLFVVVHMLLAKITISTIKAYWSVKHKEFYSIYVFVLGLLVAILFAWAFDITEKADIVKLFFGIIVSMVVYKFGPKWLFNKAEEQLKKQVKK